MNLPRFFVDRPVFAAVISIVITLLGGLAFFQLPVSQYPEVVLPTVIVSASYPGANAQTIADTLAAPLEQEINGVENMLYMSSSGTSDGKMQLTVTFKLGTNLDDAQVQVQNRVNAALQRLPEDVRRLGVTAKKQSPDLTLAVQFFSPDGSRGTFYLANYVSLQVQNRIARIPGVADANTLGGQDFTMRIWLDPNKLAAANSRRATWCAPSASRICKSPRARSGRSLRRPAPISNTPSPRWAGSRPRSSLATSCCAPARRAT